jgi:hypothetical protein
MKKEQFKIRRAIAITLISAAVAGSVAWVVPTFSAPASGGPESSTITATVPVHDLSSTPEESDELRLIGMLEHDGLVSQVKGFVVEKHKELLFIDGVRVLDDVALKYTSAVQKPEIRVKVFSLMERQRMHPEAGFLQLLLPVMMSSPCLDTKPAGDGC